MLGNIYFIVMTQHVHLNANLIEKFTKIITVLVQTKFGLQQKIVSSLYLLRKNKILKNISFF
jgi:hypothetical protein